MRKKKPVRRIVPARSAGIANPDAPFWKGERAEDIVRARVAKYPQRKTRKKKQ